MLSYISNFWLSRKRVLGFRILSYLVYVRVTESKTSIV